MKQKYDGVDDFTLNIKEETVDIMVLVEKLAEHEMTKEQKKTLENEILGHLHRIESAAYRIQHKAKIYRELSSKK